jgi:hypothetical protein
LRISARAIAILNGASTLFSGPTTAAVTHAEIARALTVADLGPVTMTGAWITAAHKPMKPAEQPRSLSLGIIRGVSAVAIHAGCIAILLWSKLPGMASHEIGGASATSNWAVIAQTWAGLTAIGYANDVDGLIRSAARLRDEPQVIFVIVGNGKELARLRQAVASQQLDNLRFVPAQPKQAILKLRDSPDLRKEMGAKARRYVAANFSRETQARHFMTLLERICESQTAQATNLLR